MIHFSTLPARYGFELLRRLEDRPTEDARPSLPGALSLAILKFDFSIRLSDRLALYEAFFPPYFAFFPSLLSFRSLAYFASICSIVGSLSRDIPPFSAYVRSYFQRSMISFCILNYACLPIRFPC